MKSSTLFIAFILSSLRLFSDAVVVRPLIEREYDSITWFPSDKISSRSLANLTMEEQLLLQIYLDELNFGPGKLDGQIGQFTESALSAFYSTLEKVETESPALALKYAFQRNNLPFVISSVPDIAEEFVSEDLPTTFELMAEKEKSNYRSYPEFMAERYHTTEKFLAKLNGSARMQALAPGVEIVVPNVRPFLIENLERRLFKEIDWIVDNFAVIDTQKKVLQIFKNNEDGKASLIAFFPITPGRKDQLKFGEWEIKNSVTFPNWRYDPLVLKGIGRSEEKDVVHVPPGPNNPVGILWNGLTAKSVGIHGTDNPDTIGRATSSGCIRMANWDVVKIPNFLRPGCKVIIQ